MIFRTLLDALAEKDEFRSCPGEEVVPVYGYNEDGELVQTGSHNLFNEIQSYAQSVDINYLMSRFQSGDVNAFDHNIRSDCMYGDFTNMPETLADVRDGVNQATALFNSLSDEVREKFDNDPLVFWSDPDVVRYFDGDFGMVDNDNSDIDSPVPAPSSEDDVKDGE